MRWPAFVVTILIGTSLGCTRSCVEDQASESKPAPVSSGSAAPSSSDSDVELGSRLWHVVPYGNELVVADDHSIRRIAKDGSTKTTIVDLGEHQGIRGMAVAFDRLIVGVFHSPGGTVVEGNGAIRAYALSSDGGAPIEIGESTASTHFVGGANVLYAYESTRPVRRWSSLARSAETSLPSNQLWVEGLVLDQGRALWVEKPTFMDQDHPARLVAEAPATDAGDAKPRAAKADAAPAIQGLVRATLTQLPDSLLGDQNNVYVLVFAPPDGSPRGSAIWAFDRKTWAPRLLARDLPSMFSAAIGDRDICLGEFGRTAEEVEKDRVFAISKETGAMRLVRMGVKNPVCAAADASSFYVSDYSGRLRRMAIPP